MTVSLHTYIYNKWTEWQNEHWQPSDS